MRLSHRYISFSIASITLLMVFAASAAPIPLYNLYHRLYDVTYQQLALTSVVYFIGAVSALIFFGRLSNHIGRKPLALLVMTLAGSACLLFTIVESAFPLILGRFLLGIACGLASSGISALVVDTAPPEKPWLPSVLVSNAPLVGLTCGAMLSGILVEYAPAPLTLCYGVAIAGLLICALLLYFTPETVKRMPGVLSSLRPQFKLPASTRAGYPVAALTFLATWSVGGFFQAFAPSIAATQLHSDSILAAAAVFSSFLLPGVMGGQVNAWVSNRTAQRGGMLLFCVALAGLIYSMYTASLPLFFVACILAGIAQGAVLTGSVGSLIKGIQEKERAGVLAVIFATSYIGAAIPTLIAGQLATILSLLELLTFYLGQAVIVTVITFKFAGRSRTSDLASAETSA